MPMLSPEQAAARTGLTVAELRQKLPHVRLSSRTIRFQQGAVEAFLAGPIRGGAMAFPALERRVGVVYFVEAIGTDRVKIGFTSKDVSERLQKLRTASPFPLRLLASAAGSMAIERSLHVRFERRRVPATEWFLLDAALAALIEHVRVRGEWP